MKISDLVAYEKVKRGLTPVQALAWEEVAAVVGAEAAQNAPIAARLPENIEPSRKAVADLRAEAGDKGKGPSAASVAVSGLDLRLDQHGTLTLCRVTKMGRLEVVGAETQAALDAIALAVACAVGSTPSHEVLKRELAPVRAIAREAGRVIYVHNRTAPAQSGGYVIDLGTPQGQAAYVTERGWFVGPNQDLAFRRGAGYGALTLPDAPEAVDAAWARVLAWLTAKGVRSKDAPVVAVLLADWMRPDTPNPLAEIVGGAGSGKTTFAAHLVALVDPTTTHGLASVQLTEEAIGAAASNRYVLAHDNAGGPLKDAEQDLLCKVTTGTVLSARKLYSQAEEFAVEVRAPVIITAILPVITRADARSRTLRIKVARRVVFMGSREVEFEFQAARPGLTGALLSMLSAGLAGLEKARCRGYQHRLIDFEQLGEAITAAVGWTPGDFQALMSTCRRDAADEAAQGSPVVGAIRKIIEDLRPKATPATKAPKQDDWVKAQGMPAVYAYLHPDGSLRVGVTLKRLHALVVQSPGAVSATERSTANALAVQEPTLAALAITYTRGKVRDGVFFEFTALAVL